MFYFSFWWKKVVRYVFSFNWVCRKLNGRNVFDHLCTAIRCLHLQTGKHAFPCQFMLLFPNNNSHQSSCSQTCSEVIFEKASLGVVRALLTYKRMGRERPLHSEDIFCKHSLHENYMKWSFGLLCNLFTHLERLLKYSNRLCIMESIRTFAGTGYRHIYIFLLCFVVKLC